MQKTGGSHSSTPCIVCGIQDEPSTPKRKQTICSPQCYEQMQKCVLVFGQNLEKQERESKEKELLKGKNKRTSNKINLTKTGD